MPGTSDPTTGRPRASASITTRDRPSERDGSTSSVDASSASTSAAVSSRCVHVTRGPSSRDEPLDRLGARPCADHVQRRLRPAPRDFAPARRRAGRRSCAARARRRRSRAAPPAAARADARETARSRRRSGRRRRARRPGRARGRRSTSETVRTASARRMAARASGSPNGLSTRRHDDPYERVDARQSPCTSTRIRARLRTRRRAASAAAASYGLCAITSAGSNSRSSRAIRRTSAP